MVWCPTWAYREFGVALIDALVEWESRWRAAGAPVQDLLEPGIDGNEVRERQTEVAVVHPDAFTWFSWHNGSLRLDAAPSGYEMRSVEEVDVLIFQMEASEGIFTSSGRETSQVRGSLLPLMDTNERQMIVLDQDTGAVYRYDAALDVRLLKVADNLESLVRLWIEVFDLVQPGYYPAVELFAFDNDLAPPDLVAKGIVSTAIMVEDAQ